MTSHSLRVQASHLLGQLSIADFNDTIRERQILQITSAFTAEMLSHFFDLAAFDALIRDDRAPASYIDIVAEGLPRRVSDLGAGKSTLALVIESVEKGATIRISDVQRFSPLLAQFTRDVRRCFAAKAQINAYLTPPFNSGFKPHFDTTDVFILQCHGSKHWKAYRDYTNRVELPLVDTPWESERYLPSNEYSDYTLRAGDVLYVPRGVMHEAGCTDEASLHLTISIWPLTPADVLLREVQRVALTDIRFRERLLWAAEGDGDLTATAEQVRVVIQELVGRIDVATMLEEERNSLADWQTGSASRSILDALERSTTKS